MENASKALIIAGAILISILLIGVGMMIYNNAIGVIQSGNMDKEEIQMFNSKFESYEGKKSGTNVKTLISTIMTNNSQSLQEDNQAKVITFTVEGQDGKTTANDLSTVRAGINAGATYSITMTYSDSGMISAIDATLVSK